jgi:hypothetical protein
MAKLKKNIIDKVKTQSQIFVLENLYNFLQPHNNNYVEFYNFIEDLGTNIEIDEEIVKYKDAKIGDKEANEHIRAFVRKLAKDVIVPEPDYQLKQSEEEKINVL